MIYLVEFQAHDGTNVLTERFATDGYNTRPSDTPANTHWEARVINPGAYKQSVFDDGTTSGEARAGYGFVEIAIGDDGVGNTADRLASHAVDGRPITIFALDSIFAQWSSRTVVFRGTMEQIEVDWTKATIRIRDRLEDLAKPIQPTLYAGTTTDGTKIEAEGQKDDLKGKPKPLAWGVNRNVPGVMSNRFRNVYDFAANGVFAFNAVRDRGVSLTAGTDYATTAALVGATVSAGQYATCKATGQIKLGSPAAGEITADIVEGAAGQRSAPKIARRILESAGFVAGTDFAADDLDALHALQAAEVGIWIGAEQRDVLPALTLILDSIGAYMAPDPLGVLRFGRIDLSGTPSGIVLDETVILTGSSSIQRLATGDDRNGVPAWQVTVQYAPSWLVQDADALSQANTTAELRAFASEEYRTAVAKNEALKTIHLRAAELTFGSLMATEADALAEASRRLGIYGVRRERYQVPLHASQAQGIRLGQIVTLRLPRLGLDAGKPMLVIGLDVTLPHRSGEGAAAGTIVLDLFG